MRHFRSFFARLKAPLLAGIHDSDLARELNIHLEMMTDDNLRAGMAPEDARRRARIVLGATAGVEENCRDARRISWLADFLQDLRQAVRTLRHKPGFAAVAILTLALGIGATALMFTVIDGVLLTPLPYADPDRIVTVSEWTDKASAYGNLWAFTYPNFSDVRRESRALMVAGWAPRGGTVTAAGSAAVPEHVDADEVSAEYFPVLGISTTAGRVFTPSDDKAGAAPVMIISQSFWRRHFAINPNAVGQTVVYEDHPYTIVGVAAADARLFHEADLYIPLGQDASPAMQNRDAHTVRGIARIRSGYTLEQARKELNLIGHGLAQQYPETNTGRTMVADTFRIDTGDNQSTLWLLLGAVSLVLLIACVNIASLLLARAVSRDREIAMRVAIGASRSRLARHCLTESALLALAGGALGVVLAVISLRPFLLLWPAALPHADAIHIDWRVLLFTLAVSLFSGIVFGLAPALRAPALQLDHSVRGADTRSGARRLHTGFVVSEIALALVLLVASGMLGRTLLRLSALDAGVNVHNLLITRASLSPATLSNPARARAAWEDLLDRVASVPGVQSVTMVDTVPMREGVNELAYSTAAALPPPDRQPLTLATSVTANYLDVMGIPLRAGRFFDRRDRPDGEPVIAIDDVLARQAFQTSNPQDAVGRQLWIPAMAPQPVRVVGVVGHVRHWGLAGDDQSPVRAQIYYPFWQLPDTLVHRWSDLMSIAVRTQVEPMSLMPALRRAAAGAGGDQVLYQERTMEQLASHSLARQRFLMLLFGVFAALALILASIGIYGVLAYLTSQRTQEVGVRMALGASTRTVLGLVLRQSAGMIAGGVIVGIAGALAAARILERFVSGMRAADPLTVLAMVAILAAAALLASFLPARRASRIDPMNALRQE